MPVVALLGTFAGGDRTGFILFPVGRHESREDRKKPVRPVNWLRFPSWCSIRLFTVTMRCGTSHKSACPEEMAERDLRGQTEQLRTLQPREDNAVDRRMLN